MAISVVLKPFTAYGEKFVPGDLVDTGPFRNESALTGSRYVRPATPEEYVEAMGLTSSFTQDVPRGTAASEPVPEEDDDVEEEDDDLDEEDDDEEDEDEEADEEDASDEEDEEEDDEPEPKLESQPKPKPKPKPESKPKPTGSHKPAAKSGGKPVAGRAVAKKPAAKKNSRRR